MAAVFRARDLSLDRECAVKVLHRHLQGDKESQQRFQREAQAVARLKHENILEVYEYGTAGDTGDEAADSFLVAEFIHGPTLRAHLLQHQPRFAEVGAMVGVELARALAIAHREGVVHRDLKPENVMIRRDETLVLCDFGIARLLDKDTMTTTGQLLGSPAYMAPEHIKGQHVDSRSDLFSLGTMMYELMTGELPFRGKNPHDTLTRIAAGTHVPLGEAAPLAGPHLCRVVERALAPEPDARYQEADVLRDDLIESLRESGIDDVRAELSAYFRDPTAWEAAFAPRLKSRLVEQGRQLRREGRLAGALEAWGRAQQLDPQDREIQALLSKMARGNRRRRVLVAASGVACVGLLLSGGYRWHNSRSRVASPATPPGSQPASQPHNASHPDWPHLTLPLVNSSTSSSSAPATGPTPVSPNDLPLRTGPVPIAQLHLRPAGNRPHPNLPPSPLLAAHTVRLEPWPKAVRVTHNGHALGAYGTDVRTVQLAAGQNEFLFENPACYTERVLLPPGVTPEEVRVRLRWKPALLMVRTYAAGGSDETREPLTADVLVDGRLVGRSGQVVALPLQGDDSSRPVEVQISAPGRRTISRSLTVRANQLSQLDLVLSPM